jgi:hypothetical protein
MEDGNFWHLGGVTRWNSQYFKYTWTFHAIICVASQLFLCFFWISLWVKNKCLQHPCFKNLCKIAQASRNSDSNAQHFLSDLLTHSWFHSMLFAHPCYQWLTLITPLPPYDVRPLPGKICPKSRNFGDVGQLGLFQLPASLTPVDNVPKPPLTTIQCHPSMKFLLCCKTWFCLAQPDLVLSENVDMESVDLGFRVGGSTI